MPALDLLVAFESVARHLSITRAAVERHITQSAMSRQIQALEAELGLQLFRRRHRALLLTDDGQMRAPAQRVAPFGLAAEATQRGYFLVVEPGAAQRPAVQALVSWLLAEAAHG